MMKEAVSTCKIRKFNADTKIFLAILLFNDVPMQKTLVEKGLATKATGNAPPATALVAPQPNLTPPTTAPAPAAIAQSPALEANPVSEVPGARSVSVISKSAQADAAPKFPAMMVPRSVKSPPPIAALPTQSRPEKTIAVASLQIGSESNNVLMFVASLTDFAILMCPTSDLSVYSGIEETILASTNELIAKRGKFEDPQRQLQKGGAVLALFEGQVWKQRFLWSDYLISHGLYIPYRYGC